MTRITPALLFALLAPGPLLAQTGQTWLRVELLVFAQNDFSSPPPGVARETDPQPDALVWPEPLVRLNDGDIEAMARRQQQTDIALRPAGDAAPTPPLAEDVELSLGANDRVALPDPYVGMAIDEAGDIGAEAVPVQTDWGLPRPWYRLPDSALMLRRDASALERSSAYRLLWHGAWMQPTRDSNRMPWLEIVGGEQFDEWRELQGAIRLYESRFLHLDIDLWLTRFVPAGSAEPGPAVPAPGEPLLGCEFLKMSWIAPAPIAGTGRDSYGCLLPQPAPPAPPAPPAVAQTFVEVAASGIAANSFRQFPDADPDKPQEGETVDLASVPEQFPAAPDPLPRWQSAHVTPFVDSRRMELGETHYIDHPRLGVIAHVTRVTLEEPPAYPPPRPEGASITTDPDSAPSAETAE